MRSVRGSRVIPCEADFSDQNTLVDASRRECLRGITVTLIVYAGFKVELLWLSILVQHLQCVDASDAPAQRRREVCLKDWVEDSHGDRRVFPRLITVTKDIWRRLVRRTI